MADDSAHLSALVAACLHCGQPAVAGRDGAPPFCCPGCASAYDLIRNLGLDRYYRQRQLDPAVRPPRPDLEVAAADLDAFAQIAPDGVATLNLMVDGLHCAACVWLVESLLARQPGVVWARVSMNTRRLVLKWRTNMVTARDLVAAVAGLGYRLVPFDARAVDAADERRDRMLLRAMAVAGFAAGNIMLLSVSVWAGNAQGMSATTRDFLHWLSALIALPAIAYAGRPFFASGLGALKARRTNMDVPISLALILAPGLSMIETIKSAPHAYFDSAVTLVFFLLIGRYLDARARGRARSSAVELLALAGTAVTVIDEAGRRRVMPPTQVKPGMVAFVPAGGRIAVDGRVVEGVSEVDTSLISGESVPAAVRPGDRVFAGTLNLTAPLRLAVTAIGDGTLLAEIARLMEAAEEGRGRFVVLADRVARFYSPVVHSLALLTFVGWTTLAGVPWQAALLNAIAVLIITCPCALALAVPVVQVAASARLMRRGILLKSATALERLSAIDAVVFDKTGTLTLGRLQLVADGRVDGETLRTASGLAAASSHPLARALHRAAPDAPLATGVRETSGAGLGRVTPAGEARLGSASWCGVGTAEPRDGPELWYAAPGKSPVRFAFRDQLRTDAAAVVDGLRRRGLEVELLSGDRAEVVGSVAAVAGIGDWSAGQAPTDKCARLAALAAAGRRVLMVGDGLNDAPALAAAFASMSPATAAEISQTAADVVFQGERLAPVSETLAVARWTARLIRENLGIALAYNLLAVPLAMFGYVTPLVAAIAMSSSSILVILNALRLNRVGIA
jgi:P-type Cu2+ transporter